jgi:cytochrome b subunit of formate dehydrogenase
VHAFALKAGKKSPGCTACHATHSKTYPPSAGAVDLLCKQCHQNAMASLEKSKHGAVGKNGAALSCASCHDVHATSNLRFSKDADKACEQCHAGAMKQFEGSVHADLFGKGKMSCLSCHKTHQLQDGSQTENYGCGACHGRAEQDYRKSAHRLARLKGDSLAASCADCHGGHRILGMKNPESPVSAQKLPETCGQCHSGKQVLTSDYVRLPISMPSYNASVHGEGRKEGKPGAVCTDCHGSHALESAASATSSIHRENLARTCGRCHDQESREYDQSIHGKALGHGIKDAPVCTDCHDEHFILSVKNPKSPTSRQEVGSKTCARCHEDPAMASRYGLSPDVVSSFNDSYHGWAITRGGEAVAICADCHGAHAIGSSKDPSSSIHTNNVVTTCAKCHAGATHTFAASYTHVLARDRRMAHDWVRLVYLWIIGLTLGGMALHNLVLYVHDLRIHYRHVAAESFIQRMERRDLFQHVLLIVSFGGLAITGFALRSQDSWWAQTLTGFGLTEELRRLLHRIFAGLLVLGSVVHTSEILFTGRGRQFFRDMFPKLSDLKDAFVNMVHHAQAKGGPAPEFDRFDYTQKAEYWALLWGTLVMGATGFILWFPALVTLWLPAWMVRVAETIHYYEAILAVSAIVIWHLFFTVVRPGIYPMSWTWITGRMPKHEWETHHGRAAKAEQAREEAAKEESSEEKTSEEKSEDKP